MIIVVVSRQLEEEVLSLFCLVKQHLDYYHIKNHTKIYKLVRLMGENGLRDESTRASRTKAANTSAGGT